MALRMLEVRGSCYNTDLNYCLILHDGQEVLACGYDKTRLRAVRQARMEYLFYKNSLIEFQKFAEKSKRHRDG